MAFASLFCFIVAESFFLAAKHQKSQHDNKQLADVVSEQLELRLARTSANLVRTPGLQTSDLAIGDYSDFGGCVRYVALSEQADFETCFRAEKTNAALPTWLLQMGTWVLGPDDKVVRRIYCGHRFQGTLTVTSQTAPMLAAFWSDSSGRISFTLFMFTMLVLSQCLLIGRAFRPVSNIEKGVDRFARGDLSCRLPDARYFELRRISEGFNALAGSLARTMSERAALAEKLADGHEQERSHLARELHDELAQHLSAVALLSASIKETADAECPTLAPEAQQLFQTTNAAIKSLHATLCTLRPPQTDELELGDSLWTLVKNEEERSGGRLRISLLIGCSLASFSEAAALHVYRIVQEGLTNIAKHTNADWARVSLVRRHEHADQDTVLVLTIENNGCRATRKIDPANRSGFGLGLVGIRERVMALRGQLDITRSAENRFKICAIIPMDPAKGVYNGTG